MKYLFRSLLICLLIIPFLWFGTRYGQAPSPAYGEIFRELSQPLLLQAQRTAAGGSAWRSSRVNAQEIPYRVEQLPGTVTSLFDTLTTPAAAQSVSLPPDVVNQGAASLAATQIHSTPLFRTEWNDWGVLGRMVSRTVPSSDKTPGSTVTTQMPPFGGILATLAFTTPETNTTLALTMWIDDAASLAAFLPTEKVDAPGRDTPEVPRYPGLRRRYTVEEENSGNESIVTVYSGHGNAYAVASFYQGRLRALGWDTQEIHEKHRPELTQTFGGVFVRKGQECVITVSPREGGIKVQAVVAFRKRKSAG